MKILKLLLGTLRFSFFFFCSHEAERKGNNEWKMQEEIEELQDRPFSCQTPDGVVNTTVRIFLGGDYDFLTECFGHQGACSKHFCLWCRITLQEKRVRKTWCQEDCLHGLSTLQQQTGREPVFPIDLDRVVVLPLHIFLGLTQAYLTMLKNEVMSNLFQKR